MHYKTALHSPLFVLSTHCEECGYGTHLPKDTQGQFTPRRVMRRSWCLPSQQMKRNVGENECAKSPCNNRTHATHAPTKRPAEHHTTHSQGWNYTQPRPELSRFLYNARPRVLFYIVMFFPVVRVVMVVTFGPDYFSIAYLCNSYHLMRILGIPTNTLLQSWAARHRQKYTQEQHALTLVCTYYSTKPTPSTKTTSTTAKLFRALPLAHNTHLIGLGTCGGIPERGLVLGPPHDARELTFLGAGLANRLAATAQRKTAGERIFRVYVHDMQHDVQESDGSFRCLHCQAIDHASS